jgi:threonine dehydratase
VAERLLTAEEVVAAAERIRPHVLRTPLVPLGDTGILCKAESLQPAGAFKLRGAFNTLLSLEPSALRRGVVAHSSGNHAIAVAWAGRALGVPTTVVMPSDAPEVKLRRTRALGATVEVVGPDSDERRRRADELAAERGLQPIEPYDSFAVLAATATIAVEVLEDLRGGPPPVLLVPVSGGGLAGGVAAGAKLLDPGVRVVGVEPEVAAVALASRRAGRRVALPAEEVARTVADGLRVRRLGALTWPHVEAFVDDLVTVTEAEILGAVRRVALDARLVVEPSGAVPVAAALSGDGERSSGSGATVAVLSGGNVDPSLLREVLAVG